MYTTYEDIRVEAGFQNRFTTQPFLTDPDGTTNRFYVTSEDSYKIVPEFRTGNTTAGVSDVKVYLGLSGIPGVSVLSVSSVNVEQGLVVLGVTPVSGSSLTISYASSPIPDIDIEDVRLRAESTINQNLAKCYTLPLTVVPTYIKRLSTELASSMLLIRNYGVGSPDTARDGNEIYTRLMGQNEYPNRGYQTVLNNGEIGMICTSNFVLVDDNGNIIPRNDGDSVISNKAFKSGGRVSGRIYDVTEEPWRFKPYQPDVNREQAGSGIPNDLIVPPVL